MARRTPLLIVIVLTVFLLASPASALGLPTPLPTVALPSPPTVSLPPLLPTPSPPLSAPKPATGASPVALTELPGGPVVGPLIRTLSHLLSGQVPVLPVLLPLIAGLLLLLVSAVLAAYRRTQEARRFEALERTKSDFMKLASHELRTPLTVLRGYVSMIRDGDIKPDTPAFRRAVPIIEERLEQVNTIIEQMLEAARLAEDSTRLESERFDLGAVAAEAVDSIRPRAGDSHPIQFEGALGEVPLVGDRRWVAGIIDQLLDNAIKYSPAGGQIDCSLEVRDGKGFFTVRDHGLGIAPDDLQRVFTSFGRLVTRDNSHIPGAGLGLYLARRHALLMGGDIAVHSRAQKGSAFTLSLPLATKP